MASACFSEDLTCSICLTVFTDPVMLLCGHSFCRECISVSLTKQPLCPHCRARVSMEGQYLLTNHILKNLAEKKKEAYKQKLEYRQDKEKGEWLCLEHDEKLKLYCITDQQLICVICRDGQKHESHKFKPVSEAATLVRAELESFVKSISEDTEALEALIKSQRKEITTTKKRSKELKLLISTQFETMYNFLKKKESELNDKVQCDEEEGVKKMTEQLNTIEAAKDENKKLKETVTSVLGIQQTEEFLRKWSEEKEVKTARSSFRPKKGNLRVQTVSLSLGPYESHLQMFVWKEMLQVIKPREENVLIQNDQTGLNVSGNLHNLLIWQFNMKQQELEQQKRQLENQLYRNRYNNYSSSHYSDYSSSSNLPTEPTQSTNTFAGQHYWEVSVDQLNDWELGLPQTFMKMCNSTYQICNSEYITAITVQDTPNKIGFYLNCPQKELSFYNADNMTLIHTASLTSTSFPVSAYFKLGEIIMEQPY